MNYVHDIETVKRLLAFSYFQKGMAFIYAGEEFGNDRTPSLFDIDTIDRNTGYDISGYISNYRKLRSSTAYSQTDFMK